MDPEMGFASGWQLMDECPSLYDTVRSAIGQASIFPGMDEGEVDCLAGLMRCYRAAAGTTLIREGDRGDYLILLIAGEIDLHKRSADGIDHVLLRLGPGNTLGEIALIDGGLRVASCVAATPVNFSVLTRGRLDYLMHEQPALGTKLLMQFSLILTRKLRQTVGALAEHLAD